MRIREVFGTCSDVETFVRRSGFGARQERVMKRNRSRPVLSFLERIAEHSKRARTKAASMAPGKERDAMLQKLKQAETAARISVWLSSGEQDAEPPEEVELLK